MRLPLASGPTITKKLLALFTQYRAHTTAVILLQLAVAALATVAPAVIGKGIDAISAGASLDHLRTFAWILGGVVLAYGLLTYVSEWQTVRLGEKIFSDLRTRVVNVVTHLPVQIVENVGTGDLLGRTTHDVDRVAFFIQRGVSQLIIVILTIVVTISAGVGVAPAIGWILLAPLLPLACSILWYVHRTMPAYLAGSAIYAGMSGVISETIEQIETVEALSLGRNRYLQMYTLLAELWKNERYTAWMRVLFLIIVRALVLSPVLLCALWGSYLYAQGAVSLGAISATCLYALQLRRPLTYVGFLIDEAQFATASLARIFGVEEAASSHNAAARSTAPRTSEKSAHIGEGISHMPHDSSVNISHVTFAYQEGRPVLHDVSMNIHDGEKIAIVGPSGAGKSTLGRLVCAISNPSSGSVKIGGISVSSINEKDLHTWVCLVTQEQHVFVGTIAENMRLASPNASDADILHALNVVGADEWVSQLPEGIETRVGSGGHKLSPAHVQQLALARIVLIDPHVLVLDEATSLLDPRAARSLEQGLARVIEGRTVISIAHRLYTAHDADRVAVMIDGRVAEIGSHDELVTLGGEYASLWNTWQSSE